MLGFWLATGYSSSAAELPSFYFIYHLGLVSLAAVILDLTFGEPKRFHPLSFFGGITNRLEKAINPYHRSNQACQPVQTGKTSQPKQSIEKTEYNFQNQTKLLGLICCLILIISICVVFVFGTLLVSQYWFGWLVFDSVILYFCIGLSSMREHVLAIAKPLEARQLTEARKACGMIVSRDVEHLTPDKMCKAAVESTLENTNDAVIASLFWYAIGGVPLAIAQRLANTMDAMWGYKTKRFLDFGWAAAKLDDVLAWPTAKVTGLLFALQAGSPRVFFGAIRNAQIQSRQYKSINGGFVMSAGATVLAITLGGEASYHGVRQSSGQLGNTSSEYKPIQIQHIRQAIGLMNCSVFIWIAVILMATISLFLVQSF